MTAMDARHSHAPPLAPAPDLAARLRGRGLRVTAQREQVLAAVRHLGHATPEEIAASTAQVDPATVYRTLELLEDLGLVGHTHLGHGAPSYQPAEDQHSHVVCHSCGRVVDADPRALDQLVRRLRVDTGFVVDRSHLTVFGRCRDCTGHEHVHEPEQTHPSGGLNG